MKSVYGMGYALVLEYIVLAYIIYKEFINSTIVLHVLLVKITLYHIYY